MNFYLIEKPDEKKSPEILGAVKQFLKERLSGAIEDPLLKLACDGSNPVFLKTPTGIIWVRVFEEILTEASLSNLCKEFERTSQMFHQKIRYYLFAPGYDTGLKMMTGVSLEIHFFEYFFIRSRFGQGIALREESKIEFVELPRAASEPLAPKEVRIPGRDQNVRLEREELSELIDLSLEFKIQRLLPSTSF